MRRTAQAFGCARVVYNDGLRRSTIET
ncbi:helix-turn-helix domain-containing protein [Micromonospora sonneratiae]|uniref:Helix-turn-helix domain-containing protein n=1 Tax=Micromonospora sonneratiae TaxID=1184706 RepID=A0ABW3YHN9_9ACTN